MKNETRFSLLLVLSGIVLLVWGSLLGSSTMFAFHDFTQAARVHDFALNLLSGVFPPRIAPNFSFHMGYPVFDFYAPTAYWITSLIHIAGFSIADSLKLSFFLALVLAGSGMYMLLRMYYSFRASLTGALLFAASPLFALEIFVRGNIAEIWFLAFLPATLYFIAYHSRNVDKRSFIMLTVSSLCLFTSHNALSIIGILVSCIFMLLQKKKSTGFIALALGLLGSAYFILPAVLELSLTHAKQVAETTKYQEHFICLPQLWSSPWGFGGSTAGCADGMSFMLGKILILFSFLGATLMLFKKDTRRISLFFLGLAFLSVFIVTEYSLSMWIILEPLLKLFQFPWRFLTLATFALAFLATYAFHEIDTKKYGRYFLAILMLVIIIHSRKYFYQNPDGQLTSQTYDTTYASQDYLEKEAAFRVPEYLPRTADYDAWRAMQKSGIEHSSLLTTLDRQPVKDLKQGPFIYEAETSSQTFLINKHYFPNWQISVNGTTFVPKEFDTLGRPKISSSELLTRIKVTYVQTPIQLFGDALSIGAFLMLLLTVSTPVWQKIKRLNAKA